MQHFTPIEYLFIDLANHYGLDKCTWDERLEWVHDNMDNIQNLHTQAENPILFQKTVRAIDSVLAKQPTGHLVSLDATTSGIQIMSALAGCKRGCTATNLIDDGDRHDVYGEVSMYMNQNNANTTRNDLKHPIMTHFYGSKAQPKNIFGEDTEELKIFYNTLEDRLPGANALMEVMQSLWHPDALSYEWIMPDGHTANFKVMKAIDKRIEVDELDHCTFTHRCYVNEPVEKGLAMAANIVHSIDGYIVRQMVRMADEQKFSILAIHDCFWCHPNYADQMRINYNKIFAEEINIDLFNHIYNQISTKSDTFQPLSRNLNKYFYEANYALS